MTTSVSRAVAVSGALVLVLAGCGLPAGVDGDLTGGWEAMPELELMAPEAGVCLNSVYREQPQLAHYDPVRCSESHLIETVHVGAFNGEAAERNTSPDPGTGHWQSAYEECDTAAADYLGADFRSGWLWLGVAVPIDPAWEAGARWFRCDVLRVDRNDEVVSATESWRDLLAGDSDLALGCWTVTTGERDGDRSPVQRRSPVECTEPHQAEFVGVWASDGSRYPTSDRDFASLHSGCIDLAAAHVDVSVDSLRRTVGLGTIIEPMSEEDWENGDRGFRCLLWLDGAQLTSSLKGAGVDALPTG